MGSAVGAATGSDVGATVAPSVGTGDGTAVDAGAGLVADTGVEGAADPGADPGMEGAADSDADPDMETVADPGAEDVEGSAVWDKAAGGLPSLSCRRARQIKIAAIPATQNITAMTIKILFPILFFILTPVSQQGCGSDHLRSFTCIPIVPHFNRPCHSKFILIPHFNM